MNILFERYQKTGDFTAKERLINGNLKLVLSIVKKYINTKHNMDDLFQVGVIGLIKAVENFDLSYNCLFSTYAVPLILGEIKRYIRDSTQLRISRGIKDQAYKILEFKESYYNKHDKEPTSGMIAKEFGISEYDVSMCLDSLKDSSSLYDPIYNDGGETILLLDQIADKKNDNIDYETELSLKSAIEMLKTRERDVLISRYYMGLTQSELASYYNISQAQVSRIEKSGLENVKKLIMK